MADTKKKLTVEEHIARAREHLDAVEGKSKDPNEMTVEEHVAAVREDRW